MGAVGEVQAYLIAVVQDLLQALAEVHGARLDRIDLQGVQVATVNGDVRGAVFAAGVITQRNARQVVTRVAVAAEPEIRVRPHQLQLLLQPHAAEYLHHVRADVNTRAKAGELRCLLVHVDFKAGLLQQSGGGCPAQSCTDDCDFLPAPHRYVPSCSVM
ncbi:hypothetical protein D3C79_851170 [compost metagenome]